MTNIEQKELDLYPIDYPIETLLGRMKDEWFWSKLKLNPDFQRQYCWDKNWHERWSKFIESCLMRIPIPACYFAEDENKNHIVIDWVQRLTTLFNFYNNGFPLEWLSFYDHLNWKTFSELPDDNKNDLLNYTIRCVVLRKTNSEKMIREIFARLNQGSVMLTPQQIRHALYPSLLDELLANLSNTFSDDLTRFISWKDNSVRQEFILRFFAFYNDLTLESYNDNLKEYLDDYMESMQTITSEEIIILSNVFIDSLNKCKAVFGDKVFCKPEWARSKGIASYYDLLMLSFSTIDNNFLTEKRESIISAFSELTKDERFNYISNQWTQRKSNILERRKMWDNKLSVL